MYAIVEIAGQQFKVETGKRIFVHRLPEEKEADIEFDKVLLVEDVGKILVGEPFIKDYIVAVHVLDHVKGDKVIVFKKKRKKGYRVKNGHRQNFTQVEITGIGEKGNLIRQSPKKVKERASELPAEEITVTEKKSSAGKGTSKKAVEKPAGTAEEKGKKTTAKKVAEKKPAVKKSSKSKE